MFYRQRTSGRDEHLVPAPRVYSGGHADLRRTEDVSEDDSVHSFEAC